MEDLEDRMMKLEIAIEAEGEFVVERLSEIERRMDLLEQRQEADSSSLRSEIMKEVEELSASVNLSKSFEIATYTSTPLKGIGKGRGSPVDSCSLPSRSSAFQPFQIPRILDDVADPIVKEKIRNFVPTVRDVKEKLNPVQSAFCLSWLSEEQPETARKSNGRALWEAGLQAGMWDRNWKPDIVGDFESYLVDKIKQYLKKLKKEALRQSLKRKSNASDDA